MNPVILVVVSISMAIEPMQKSVKTQAPQFGTTRVAVVNIGKVFNQYDRAKEFKADLEKTLQPFKDKAKRLTKNIESWEAAVKNKDFRAASKEAYEEKIINAKRELEDMGRKIQADLGARQEQNLITLWKEVQMGISAVATDQKIDVVFGYGDPVEKDLLDLFPNVNRKMQAMDLGSTVPLFMTKRVDITEIVVHNLNHWTRELKKQAVPAFDFE
jgi:Skp family chaperone for outer membrane proteins